MMHAALNLILLAQTAGAPATPPAGTTAAVPAAAERTAYELRRLQYFDDERVPIALIVITVVLLAAIVWYLYRRDTIELPTWPKAGVMLLRFIAIAGLLIFFLGIERRT